MMRLALVLMTGCSFMFTSTPKTGQPCSSSEASPIADGAFAVLLGLGTIGFIGDAANGGSDAAGGALVTGILTATFAASAVVGFNNVGKCRKQEKEEYEEAVEAQRRPAPDSVPASRKDAWQMTKQAKAAARAGDCETVATYDEVVRSVDPEFHTTVFSRDAAIVRCLSSREIPVEPPAPSNPATPPPSTSQTPVAPPPTP